MSDRPEVVVALLLVVVVLMYLGIAGYAMAVFH